MSDRSEDASVDFAADPALQQIAAAYALDAVGFARDHFRLSLDWTDASIQHVEKMLDKFHKQLKSAKPTEEQVSRFAKVFGSYVGEVFRRNHGATWGIITLQAQSVPGLKASGAAGVFWPWGRAQNRLLLGPQDNVWHYYQVLVQSNGPAPPA